MSTIPSRLHFQRQPPSTGHLIPERHEGFEQTFNAVQVYRALLSLFLPLREDSGRLSSLVAAPKGFNLH